MKRIAIIVILELKKLIFSPIIWLILIVFLVQVSFGFIERIENFYGYYIRQGDISDIASRIFRINYPTGVFEVLTSNLYIYIPLITMGLVSKEINTGSIKLLASSPISTWHIVLGKFGAMIIYSLLLTCLSVLYMILGHSFFTNFDSGVVFSGILGFFLLLMSYSAIGLFISSLTKYQVVSAIATFGVISLLNNIGNIGQEIPFLNDFFYWASIKGRAEQMMEGLISTSSLVYFLIIISLFVLLTKYSIAGIQRNNSSGGLLGKIFLLALLIGGFGHFSSLPKYTFYWDLTASKKRTLTQDSQKVAQKFNGKEVTIKTYVNLLSELTRISGLPSNKNNDFRRFEYYTRFIPQLKVEHIYFYDSITGNTNLIDRFPDESIEEIASKMAKSYGLDFEKVLSPNQIREIVDLSSENNEYVRLIEANGKSAFLRMYYDTYHYPQQVHISTALKSLFVKPPKVGFLTNHDERAYSSKMDRDYYLTMFAGSDNRHSLRNLGFDFTDISLREKDKLTEVDILVVSDPNEPYSELEIKKIKEYLEEGNNMFLLLEENSYQNVEPILELLGIETISGKLKSVDSEYSDDIIYAKVTDSTGQLSTNPEFQRNLSSSNLPPVLLDGAVGLSVSNDSNSKLEFNIFTSLETASNAIITKEKDTTSLKNSPIPLGICMKRLVDGKEQRVAIIGDADVMSNKTYTKRIPKSNSYIFVEPIFSWLSNGEFPVVDMVPFLPASKMLIDGNDIKILKIVLMYMVPLILLLGSIALLINRRRY